MIARMWHGWTTNSDADAYERLLRTKILPSIAAKNLPGYHRAHLMRRQGDGEVEFVTILWFDSLDGVRALAGEAYETAYVPREAQALLDRFDSHAQHYQLVLAPE
jgi:antibiotic biosynthesis monooxygenase (ABM) superfamily enzyme